MPVEGPLRYGRGADFHLIETMRWEPGVGVVRQERHLARLARSAGALDFVLDENAIRDRLAEVDAAGPLRLRLTLQRDGLVGLETFTFTPLAPDTMWRIAIATTRLRSDDPLLVHKTSLRGSYEAARAEFDARACEEVILLNEHDQVCEGTITSVFVRVDGRLLTPHLGCGLLAGVLREEMLETGVAGEGVISLSDLRRADEIFVGNSLRGLIPAILVDGQP